MHHIRIGISDTSDRDRYRFLIANLGAAIRHGQDSSMYSRDMATFKISLAIRTCDIPLTRKQIDKLIGQIKQIPILEAIDEEESVA